MLVTTEKQVTGINFYKECYVLFAYMPTDLFDYEQCMGRANRVKYDAPKRGGCVVSSALDQGSIEATLRSNYIANRAQTYLKNPKKTEKIGA